MTSHAPAQESSQLVMRNVAELAQRQQTRELGSSLARQIFRLLKVAQFHALDNMAFLQQLDQTVEALRVFGAQTGEPLTLLFAKSTVFVCGQLLKASRAEYEAALELSDMVRRLGVTQLTIQTDAERADLTALARLFQPPMKTKAEHGVLEPSPRVRLRYVSAARLDENEQEMSPEDQILRTYATTVVVMRRVYENLMAARYQLPNQAKRLAQRLVVLSEGDTPAFLGVTAMRNLNHDAAGRAVNRSILAVSMGRQLTGDLATLSRIAMSALFFDVATPLVTGIAGMGDQVVVARMTEDAERRLPAATAAVLTALGQVRDASLVRTVIAYEAHWLRQADRLGPMYDGEYKPMVAARIVATAHRFNQLMETDLAAAQAPNVDDALAQLGSEARDAVDQAMLVLLIGALGVFPRGTPVELSTGESAVVLRTPDNPANYPRPTVRLVYDASGQPLRMKVALDLAADDNRQIARVITNPDATLLEACQAVVQAAAPPPRPAAAPTAPPLPPTERPGGRIPSVRDLALDVTPGRQRTPSVHELERGAAPAQRRVPSVQELELGQAQRERMPSAHELELDAAPAQRRVPSVQELELDTAPAQRRVPTVPSLELDTAPAQRRAPSVQELELGQAPRERTPSVHELELDTTPARRRVPSVQELELAQAPRERTPSVHELELDTAPAGRRVPTAPSLELGQAPRERTPSVHELELDITAPRNRMPSAADAAPDSARRVPSVPPASTPPASVRMRRPRSSLIEVVEAPPSRRDPRSEDFDPEASAPEPPPRPPRKPSVRLSRRPASVPPVAELEELVPDTQDIVTAEPSDPSSQWRRAPAALQPADAEVGAGLGAQTHAPSASGSLERTPFSNVLVYILDRALGGTLILTEPVERPGDAAVEHAVYFQDGIPTKAHTGARVAALGPMLVAYGVLDQTQLESDPISQPPSHEATLESELLESGLARVEQIAEIRNDQLDERLTYLFGLPPATRYAFYNGFDLVEPIWGNVPGVVSPLGAMTRGLREHPEEAAMDRLLLRLGGAPLQMHDEADLMAFDFSEPELAVAAAIANDPLSVPDLVEAGHDPDVVRRVVYELMLTHCVAPRAAR